MSLKAQIEAIIYVAEEPVTLAQLSVVLCAPPPSSASAPDSPPAPAPAPGDVAPGDVASVDVASVDVAPPAEEVAGDVASDDGMAPAPEPDANAAPDEPPAPDLVLEPDPPPALTPEDIRVAVEELIAEYRSDSRGIEIKEVAGGYKMATKPEHHDSVRRFVKSLKPPMKLSLAALETLAVVAYRQPVTIPEIGDVRGVNTGGVIKTLLDKRLVTTAGRKNVIGRPILYRTTKEFLVQFGLKDVSELPSLKEFEELARSLTEES
jgi:segregation and condensation protein B